MLNTKDSKICLCLLVVAIAIYAGSALSVQRSRDRLDPTQVISALQVRPQVLEILSGEFRSLLADYLVLKASVYLGGRYSTPDTCKKAVSILFRQSATLDPRFFQTCYLVQGIEPWWKGIWVKKAITTLELFRKHRDWDWQPGFFIGFDYFYFLKDNLSASRVLMQTAEIPNAPPLLGLLGARLSQQGDQTKASIAFLETMLDTAGKESAKTEIKRRIEALKGVLKLERGITMYRARFGHPPDSLECLVESGILKDVPVNPCRRDGRYLYNRGKVGF